MFGERADLVHCTSALRYPVFKHAENYNGTPSMVKHPELRQMLTSCLAEEARILGKTTLWLPLGPKVTEALEFLCREGVLSPSQVLDGMPHPSGANAERIKIFLGEKKPEDASQKTNPATILEARAGLLNKLIAIR